MRLGLIHTQTLHEPAVLLRCQCPGLAFLPGPLEAASLQPLVQQNKSVALPVQCLDPVPSSAAEEEQCVAKRVQVELLLNKRRQAVYPAAQICVTAGNIHPVRTVEIAQHDFRIRSTVSTVTASAPE